MNEESHCITKEKRLKMNKMMTQFLQALDSMCKKNWDCSFSILVKLII